MSKTLPTAFDGTVTLGRAIAARCPVDGSRDWYNLTIRYAPDGKTVELGWLAAYLDAFVDERIPQEDLCAEITAEIEYQLGRDVESVELVGQHAGITTRTTSP